MKSSEAKSIMVLIIDRITGINAVGTKTNIHHDVSVIRIVDRRRSAKREACSKNPETHWCPLKKKKVMGISIGTENTGRPVSRA